MASLKSELKKADEQDLEKTVKHEIKQRNIEKIKNN
jgi:hypothetical protein